MELISLAINDADAGGWLTLVIPVGFLLLVLAVGLDDAPPGAVSGAYSDGPGPWLRLTALAGAAATLLVVVAAALHLDLAHRVLAAAALPPLVAVAVASVVAHRRLRPAALTALALFLAEVAAGGVSSLTGRPGWAVTLHVVVAAAALAAALVSAAATFRERSRGPGGLARLRHAHQAADHVAPAPDRRLRDGGRRRRVPRAGPRCRDDGRPRARVRRRERVQPPARPRHRQDDVSHRPPPGGVRPRLASARARVRPRALGRVVRAARGGRERRRSGARPGRKPVLRVRLHPLAEALDAAEHRHRRRGGRRSAARRLGGRDRPDHAARRWPCS